MREVIEIFQTTYALFHALLLLFIELNKAYLVWNILITSHIINEIMQQTKKTRLMVSNNSYSSQGVLDNATAYLCSVFEYQTKFAFFFNSQQLFIWDVNLMLTIKVYIAYNC